MKKNKEVSWTVLLLALLLGVFVGLLVYVVLGWLFVLTLSWFGISLAIWQGTIIVFLVSVVSGGIIRK